MRHGRCTTRTYRVLPAEQYSYYTKQIVAIESFNKGHDWTCFDVRPLLSVLLQNDPEGIHLVATNPLLPDPLFSLPVEHWKVETKGPKQAR
jgi:hypothetical protein